ncbi:MAG: hypothetical protein GY697_18145 [Desulfobacterales bacterium]|nr:hypothetical protein [Desulfobacterales bacterium]
MGGLAYPPCIELFVTKRFKRLFVLILVAGFATTVVFLSFPRFTSSLTYLPVEAALKRNWGDYPIKKNQFPVLIGFAKKAIRKLDLGRYWQGLGWLYYLQLNATNINAAEGKKLLNLSQEAFERSLEKSPADPATWLRLAWLHAWLRHDTGLVVKSLSMSFYTGRAERYIILNRLDLALRYAAYFEEQDLSLIRDQIQLAWRILKTDMLELIEADAFDKHVLLGLIRDSHPELAAEIEEKL